jgi:hypothetical protein
LWILHGSFRCHCTHFDRAFCAQSSVHRKRRMKPSKIFLFFEAKRKDEAKQNLGTRDRISLGIVLQMLNAHCAPQTCTHLPRHAWMVETGLWAASATAGQDKVIAAKSVVGCLDRCAFEFETQMAGVSVACSTQLKATNLQDINLAQCAAAYEHLLHIWPCCRQSPHRGSSIRCAMRKSCQARCCCFCYLSINGTTLCTATRD